jgi:hypothetical protein
MWLYFLKKLYKIELKFLTKVREIDTEPMCSVEDTTLNPMYNSYNDNLLSYNLKFFIKNVLGNLTHTHKTHNLYNYKNKNYLKILKQFLNYNERVRKMCSLNIVILKIKKKQLYSNIIINNACKKLITNGIILKKLNISKKSQKKNNKISSINLKKISEYLHSNIKSRSVFINTYSSKYSILKLSNTIRTIFKKFQITYTYSPQNKNTNTYKKIKSIKKKLKKKYANRF